MIRKRKQFFILFIILFSSLIYAEDKFFIFVITSYNNEQWVERNLESIFAQNYNNYHILYVDDASTDTTFQKIEACCLKHNKSHQLTYIKHDYNRKPLYGVSNTIHSYCKDEDIVILVDGDDWLGPNREILNSLNQIYQNSEIWITYGEFSVLSDPQGRHETAPYSQDTIENGTFRKEKFYFMPLRSFYAKLFKKIKISDFFYNYRFINITGDMVFGISMLEMAQSHIYYFPDTVYVYNNVLTTNDNSLNPYQQIYFDFYIRNREPYKPLSNLFEKTPLKTALYYFCNKKSSFEEFMHDINTIKSTFKPSSTLVGTTHFNAHLLPLMDSSFQVLTNCYYHSWTSFETTSNEKEKLIKAIIKLDADFIIFTQNGYNRYYSCSISELLNLTDFIVIGQYNRPLEKNIFNMYPHVSCMPLNSIGNILDFRELSTYIIKKEKLLYVLQKATWVNCSYLSILAAIDTVYGNEYGFFIESN